MSILIEVLIEELDRLDRQEIAYQEALLGYSKGYISKKMINGRIYHYLQWKESGKVVCRYISMKDLPDVEEKIQRRRQLEASLKRVKADQKKLRKIIGGKYE